MADLNIRAILKDEFSAQTEKLVAELKKVEAAGKDAGKELKGGMSSALPSVQSVTDALGHQNAQLRAQIAAYKDPAGAKYIAEQQKLKRELDQVTQASVAQKHGLTDIAAGYYAISGALSSISGAAMGVLDATARFDSLTVRLNVMEGSAQAGARAMEKLHELAKRPGLGLEEAASSYAGLRALKQDGPDALRIIEAIAKANASMGGGAEEFGRAMRQIQQMLGKGKLLAEDINVISESIPNFRALLLEAFGTVDTKVLNTNYTIEQLLKGIEKASAKIGKPGDTIRNNLDNISDSWDRMSAALGKGIALDRAVGGLEKLLSLLVPVAEGIGKVTSWAGGNASEMMNVAWGGGRKPADTPLWGLDNVDTPIGRVPERAKKRIQGWGELHPGQKLPTTKPKPSSTVAAPRGEWMNYLDDSEMTNVKYRWNQVRGGSGKEQAEESKRINKIKDDDLKKELRRIEKENEAELDKQKEIDQIKADFDKRQIDRAREKYERMSSLATNYANQMSDTLASAFTRIWKDGEDTFSALYDAFSEMITKMVIEMAAKAAIFAIFNTLSGGQGNLLGGASSFIFGARASGGVMFPGVPYRFNEDRYSGSGGEVFRPASGGSASPDRGRGGGGTTTHYHFAAGTTKSDSGAIVRAIQQATRERSRTATRRG